MAADIQWPFSGIESIKQNYSQAWQDIFVLVATQGLRGGTYLEIGGHVPVENNNTFLLSQHFGWSGVSIELDVHHFPYWSAQRPHSRLTVVDALKVDYAEALPFWFGQNQRRVDYLQLDIDPSINTLGVLNRLPLDQWRFTVITFETDIYKGDARARDESRRILAKYGYQLVAKDVNVLFSPVSPDPVSFEDWWVDPTLIRSEIVQNLISISQVSSWPQDLLFAR